MPPRAGQTKASRHYFILFFLSEKGWKEATSDSTQVIIKLDLLGHHMWWKVLLGLSIHTQGVKQRKGKKQSRWQLSLASINNGQSLAWSGGSDSNSTRWGAFLKKLEEAGLELVHAGNGRRSKNKSKWMEIKQQEMGIWHKVGIWNCREVSVIRLYRVSGQKKREKECRCVHWIKCRWKRGQQGKKKSRWNHNE